MACLHCEDLRDEVTFLKRELSLRLDGDSTMRLKLEWRLTPTEAEILAALYRRPGAVISRGSIWDSLYSDGDSEPEMKIVDVYVSKLRAKLPPNYILTVWGTGYVLSAIAALTIDELLSGDIRPPVETQTRQPTGPRPKRAVSIPRLTALRLLAQGPRTYREIEDVLPAGSKYQAATMAACFVRDGRATRIPGTVPGQLSRWCLTKAGFEYLAKIEVHLLAAA